MNANKLFVGVLGAAVLLGVVPTLLRSSGAAEGKKGKATPAAATPAATPEKAPATPAPKAAVEPAATPAAPAEAGPPLNPSDLEGLRAKLGSTVTVEGIPTRAGESKSKTVRFLDFGPAGQAVTAVFFVGKGEAISLEEIQQYIGKNLRVTGKLSEYNGKLQIPIEQKAQIVEVTP